MFSRKSKAEKASAQQSAEVADAIAEAVAAPKRGRARRVLFLGALVGGLVALAKSPLKSRLMKRKEEPQEPEAITLPSRDSSSEKSSPASGN